MHDANNMLEFYALSPQGYDETTKKRCVGFRFVYFDDGPKVFYIAFMVGSTSEPYAKLKLIAPVTIAPEAKMGPQLKRVRDRLETAINADGLIMEGLAKRHPLYSYLTESEELATVPGGSYEQCARLMEVFAEACREKRGISNHKNISA